MEQGERSRLTWTQHHLKRSFSKHGEVVRAGKGTERQGGTCHPHFRRRRFPAARAWRRPFFAFRGDARTRCGTCTGTAVHAAWWWWGPSRPSSSSVPLASLSLHAPLLAGLGSDDVRPSQRRGGGPLSSVPLASLSLHAPLLAGLGSDDVRPSRRRGGGPSSSVPLASLLAPLATGLGSANVHPSRRRGGGRLPWGGMKV